MTIEESLISIKTQIQNLEDEILYKEQSIQVEKINIKDLRKKAKQLEKLQKKAAELVGK